MSKILESLKELKHWKETNNEKGVVWLPLFAVEDILKDLTELEQIKNAEPSEAMEWLDKFKGIEISEMPFKDDCGTKEVDLNEVRNVGSPLNNDFHKFVHTLENYILKSQKQEKILSIIEEYQVDVWLLKQCDYENYIRIRKEAMVSVGQIINEEGIILEDEIAEEEFNKLQRYFDNE